MGEIDEWYIQEQPPTEDCLLYPTRCPECIVERKQCLLNLFNTDGKKEKTQKHRGEHNDKSSQEIEKS